MSQLNTKIKQAPYIPGLKSGVLAAQRDKLTDWVKNSESEGYEIEFSAW